MQDRPSGTLPRHLLISEIDEVGRSLASLLRSGSPLERRRRPEVRALLREAFLATQEDRTIDQLTLTLNRLRVLQDEFAGAPDSALISRLDRRREFASLDDKMARCGDFSAPAEQQAESLASHIQERIERTLSTVKDTETEEGTEGPRPMRHQNEAKELVTKKID